MSSPRLHAREVPAGAATAGSPARSSRGPRLPRLVRAGDWLDRRHLIVYVTVAVVGAALFVINLPRAPDFDIDEVLYVFAGQRIALHNSISWGPTPVLVHPPLYFLSVAGWLVMLGDLHKPILTAIHAARYLNVFFCVGDALLTASLAKALNRRAGAFRAFVMLLSGLLVAFDPFLLRFGRNVLIEPMALFMGLLAVRVAWGLRDKPARVYVPVYGLLVGLSVLTKEPAIFVSAAPLVAAVLRWDRREIGRNLAALLVGAFVFSAFVIYCAVQGQARALANQSTFSFDRLIGTVQVTGLNRPNVSPLLSFTDTFFQYSSGYILLATGGISLVAAVRRLGRRIREDDIACMLCGFGIISFVFLFYSIFIGQSNEQLTVYCVPASVLLTFLGWELRRGGALYFPKRGRVDRRRRHRQITAVRGAGAALALAAGVLSWAAYLANTADDATARAEHYIETSLPMCTTVNSTGEPFRWATTLSNYPLTGYGDGPQALANGVHVFLLSPKDAKFYYGASNPQLNDWIESHGREVFSAPSHTYGSIQVWVVGTVPAPTRSSDCSYVFPAVAPDARATVFLTTLGGVLAVVALATVIVARRPRADRDIAATVE